jgi:hypothetical protein
MTERVLAMGEARGALRALGALGARTIGLARTQKSRQ